MKTRLFVEATVAIVCLIGPAISGTDDSDAPVRFHKHGVTEVLHNHLKPILLNVYPNITYLDNPFLLTCLSASGCIVTSTSEAALPNGAAVTNLCAYVDGVPMKPSCSGQGQGKVNDMQGQLVPQGTHTFQIGMQSGDTVSGFEACPCEFTFTLYDEAN